jgi:hypothetical protein
MTTDAHSAASSHRGGRAHQPGPRKVYLGAALAAIAIAVILVLAIAPSAKHAASPYSIKALDKHITIPTVPTPTVVTATAQKPDLGAMEGNPVTAQVAGGSSQLFVAGPAVPSWVPAQASAGKLVTGSVVPATFDVSFSGTQGTVALAADQFTLLTYQGKILHPSVKLATGGPLPATLPAGRTLALKVTAPMPEGDGTIRWAPDTRHIVVAYFWTLEFD